MDQIITAIRDGNISYTQEKLHINNVIAVFSHVNDIHSTIKEWMATHSLYGTLLPYYDSMYTPSISPLWTKLLATAIVICNLPLVTRIIGIHRKDITIVQIEKIRILPIQCTQYKEIYISYVISMIKNTKNDRLYFYSRSADKPVGKGSNEYVHDISLYDILSTIPGWRQILSNFYVYPFIYNGYKFNTVEHAFQMEKIYLPDKGNNIPLKKSGAYIFTIDSGSSLGTSDGEAARGKRKMRILNASQLHQWNQIKDKIMRDILYAKFTQVDIAKRTLLATNDAILEHGGPRIKKERQYILESIRDQIRIDTFHP